MKKLIRYIYRETDIGYMLIVSIRRFYDLIVYKTIPDDVYLKKDFKQNFGFELNLDDPKTLNEKIYWLKINDRTNLHTTCADKYAVRDYVRKQIGEKYLIPLLYHTTDPKNINEENLPDKPFIIKTNHDSGNVTIVMDKKDINWKRVQKKQALSLKNNYYYAGREWQYNNIKPRILVEKLLLDEDNKIPNDYKLHCFNGKLVFTQVDLGRFEDHRRNLYDENWNLINCEWGRFPNGVATEKPKNMNKMQELAEKLATPFDYVRVDFYSIDDNIYFGELTFHPGSGAEHFSPNEWDRKFGNMLSLTYKN